jgi:HrpA-like RNA helicase
MTTGIFLMRLVNNPDSLARYTHIIMDEVHERDLDIDFCLVVLKHLLASMDKVGLNFKLILMSATFNTELFAHYFSKSSIVNIEHTEVYVGIEEQYRKEEEERKIKLAKEWGGMGNAWDKIAQEKDTQMNGDEDEWVEEK